MCGKKFLCILLFLVFFALSDSSVSWAVPKPPDGILPFEMGDSEAIIARKIKSMNLREVQRVKEQDTLEIVYSGTLLSAPGTLILALYEDRLCVIQAILDKYDKDNWKSLLRLLTQKFGESDDGYDEKRWIVERIFISLERFPPEPVGMALTFEDFSIIDKMQKDRDSRR